MTYLGTDTAAIHLVLLPRSKLRWDRIGISATLQVAILLFFQAIPLLYPEKIKTALNMEIVPLAAPVTEILLAPPAPKVKAKLPPLPKPGIIEPVNLSPKQPYIFLRPKALQPMIRSVEAKAPDINPDFQSVKIEANTNQPKRPRDEVKLNNLSSGSAALATVNLSALKIQTGGFGEVNGLPGKADPDKMTNINRQGSPTLPSGPRYGNGTGDDKVVRGTVSSTGLGNSTALPPTMRGIVQSTSDATLPIILYKPRPEYSTEARTLKIEGDVVLDVVFLASGTIQVCRIISGPGHGLDETASLAARQIKFKPARRSGQPVDYPAHVRVEFRLVH
jgi:TonB family protein